MGSNIAPDGQPVTAVRVTDSGLYRTQPGSTSFHQVNDGATIQFAAGNKTVNVGGFEVEPAVAETFPSSNRFSTIANCASVPS